MPHLWHFGVILGRSRAPLWQFRMGLKVPTYPPGCVPPSSNINPCSTTNLEPPGQLMAPYASFMAFWGHFGPFQGPPMAIPDGSKGSNIPAWMCPTKFQHKSMQYHQFGASRAAYGPICLIYGILGSFWAVPEPPYGTFGWI